MFSRQSFGRFLSQPGRVRPIKHAKRVSPPLFLERLEERALLSNWSPIGPAPNSGYPELGHPAGRTEVLAPDPSNGNVMYLGSDYGGVWKTTNWLDPNGPKWTAETDFQSSLQFGPLGYQDLEVAPSNDQVVFGAVSGTGGGILRTLNGGQTWTLLANATFEGAVFGSLAINPTSTNTLYVTVWSGGKEGGVYKSTDQGQTWTNTTAAIHFGGASDIVLDPTHPNTLYAGLVGNSTAGVYKTTDGGTHWTKLTNGILSGLAVGSTIRLALSASPKSNATSVYATIFDYDLVPQVGQIPHRFRTVDGGSTWVSLPWLPGEIDGNPQTNTAETRPWHVLLAADPRQPNTVFANAAYKLYWSQDGGQHWSTVPKELGDDFIGISFDHAGGWDLFGDRSIYRSTDQGNSWSPQQGHLQITEFYDITLDPTNVNNAYGIAQDQAAALHYSGNPVWKYVAGQVGQQQNVPIGGETGKVLIDPTNPQNLYEFNPLAPDWFVMRSQDGGTTWSNSLANFVNQGGDYNFAYSNQRSFAMDPGNPQHLVLGLTNSYFYETTNGGNFWDTVSPIPVNPPPANPLYVTALAIAPSAGET
jgi:photosystem II stability/assembly factor-like uncharacterized protein